MARVIVVGAGIFGHTAAAYLRRWLGRDDEVVVGGPVVRITVQEEIR